jgi:hypothetical protein
MFLAFHRKQDIEITLFYNRKSNTSLLNKNLKNSTALLASSENGNFTLSISIYQSELIFEQYNAWVFLCITIKNLSKRKRLESTSIFRNQLKLETGKSAKYSFVVIVSVLRLCYAFGHYWQC